MTQQIERCACGVWTDRAPCDECEATEKAKAAPRPAVHTDQHAMVLAFHEKFGCVIGERPAFPDEATAALRCNLIKEEFKELNDAIAAGDLVEVADALADLLYVVHGSAITFGIDIRPIFAEVHASNMRKDGGGSRPDGKILKPPGWQPPNLAPILAQMKLK